jgi:hypothetical protein
MSCPHASHLHLPSFFHLYLFCHHIIGQGEAIYNSVLNAPSTSSSFLASYCMESCLFFFGFFHAEILAYQSRKRRLIGVFSHPSGMISGGVLPGFLGIYFHFLEAQFQPREGAKESLPTLHEPTTPGDGWRVTIGDMPTHSPGRQEATTKESKKLN